MRWMISGCWTARLPTTKKVERTPCPSSASRSRGVCSGWSVVEGEVDRRQVTVGQEQPARRDPHERPPCAHAAEMTERGDPRPSRRWLVHLGRYPAQYTKFLHDRDAPATLD